MNRLGSGKTGKEKVMPGMCVTIEPGVYVNGRFGVRIEDSVIIKSANGKSIVPRSETRSLI